MHIGNILLISPALYLIAAAIVVLIVGVIAAKNPNGKLEHYFSAHYLAPSLLVPALIPAGWAIFASLQLVKYPVLLTINEAKHYVNPVSLFVTGSGAAQLTVDPFGAIFAFVAIAGTLIVMLLSIDYFGEYQPHKAEYYSLLMFATAAACFAACASDLLAIFLSLEFLSLISYLLASYVKTDRRSAEAGLKYFLYGAACSAVMLYGISILFGITGGSTELGTVAASFTAIDGPAMTGAGWVAIVFILVGFGFKLALVPFHFWAPDAYEGAPTPVTAFLSVVSKAAGFAVVVRFLLIATSSYTPSQFHWYWLIVALCVLSMFYGNLVALSQKNIKRLLAYSSIAHVGYILIGILAAMYEFNPGNIDVKSTVVRADVTIQNISGFGLPHWALLSVVVYVFAYLFMNLGVFAVISAIGKAIKSDKIDSYSGLMKSSPFYAICLTIFLISLSGVPPTAGFLGKFLVFGSAVKIGAAGHPELIILTIFAIINSVISVYYYLNIVRLMFFGKTDRKYIPKNSFAVKTAAVVCAVFVFAIMIFASPIIRLALKSVYDCSANMNSISLEKYDR
ncbi:MAG: NADH-quinone oxidoreductase subunit N [Armatimonadota bacterium]